MVDSYELTDITNTARLLNALADVPPQKTTVREKTVIQMERGLVPVQIGDSSRRLAFDTGANFSVVMYSEAEALGLYIKKVGLDVRTATDMKVQADVTVVEQLTIGNVDLRNVVFLVFPDEFLTFPGGYKIPGVIGFPVISAMGEVRFQKRGILEIPKTPPSRPERNLALDDLELLVRVQYKADKLVCRLDTGAGKTVFYESFYQRYRSSIVPLDNLVMIKSGGVGGIREISAYQLPEAKLILGDKIVMLKEVNVYTKAITEDDENYLFGNIGRNLLNQFDEYIINFRSMSLLLK